MSNTTGVEALTAQTRDQAATATTLQDQPMSTRAKLVAGWTSFMFLYAYVDILAFFKPGVVEDILVGVVWEFDISHALLAGMLALIAVPILMVVLSAVLPARVARPVTLVVAVLYLPFSAFNAVGESWMAFYGLGVALEVAVLAFILRTAWTWPRLATSRTATERVVTRQAVGTSAG